MTLRSARLLVTLGVLLGATACEKIDTGPDPDSTEALYGFWRHTGVGVLERTIEFFPDGTLFQVEANWRENTCGSAAGMWSVDAPGVLTIQYTARDGAPVSEAALALPYFIDSSRLGITFPTSFGPEMHAQLQATMPTCADYGWMSMLMSADVDGATTDFSWTGFYDVDLESGVGTGFLPIIGYYDPNAVASGPLCGTCDVLNIDLFHELGVALTLGDYPVETFGPTGLRAETQYLSPGSSTNYGSNDSDPNSQPWSGQAQVTRLTSELIEGSFEFILYDATGAGPPYPSVTITNGSFRLTFG